jgi:hypothetical protein
LVFLISRDSRNSICLISNSLSKWFIRHHQTLFVTSWLMSTTQEAIATGYLSGKKLSESNKRSRQVITTKFINKYIYDNLTSRRMIISSVAVIFRTGSG